MYHGVPLLTQCGRSISSQLWTRLLRKAAPRKFLRPAIILVIAVLLFFFTESLLWVAGLLLALFFFAVDVLNIDKSSSKVSTHSELYPAHQTSVLGHYEIDSTQCYGLFISLAGNSVFVDIREDKLIEKRKEFAKYLAQNTTALEASLNEFMQAQPGFSSRYIASIGLHSKVLDQGEVFWFPEGHTRLRGCEFSA